MASLYREFKLTHPEALAAVGAFLRANLQAYIDRGNPLRVIVTESETKRSLEQNAVLHCVLRTIAETAWWDGRQFDEVFWKEYFRRRYLLKDEVTAPTGEIFQIYWSTADLSYDAFKEFMAKVEAEAASEWGVEFP